MIKINTDNTVVEFGKDNVGAISIESLYSILVLREVKGNKLPIGSTISKEEANELPKVILHFNDVASVDVLIEKLNEIKNSLNNNECNIVGLAC